jgi:tetratricopeptide (TPR) repeat protein
MKAKSVYVFVQAVILAAATMNAGAGSLSADDVPRILQEGNYLFMKANELSKQDPWQAKELYVKAAGYFESIALEGGIRNEKLYYNIGNAYFMSGDIGRAILAYRRALALNPNDANLVHNLAFARSKRIDAIEPRESDRITRIIFFWHYDIPSIVRLALFLAFFAGIWIFLGLGLFARRALFNWGIAVCAALALLALGSLLTDAVTEASSKHGVIVQNEVTARKGDGETYEPSFTEPLHSGTEFRLLESRHGWERIALDDGRQAWIPENAAGTVER